MGFDEISAAVVDYLKVVLPLGFWAVTRFDGVRQLYLEVRDDAYGLSAGDSHLWNDSMCIEMVAGRAPRIAPDARAIPSYASARISSQIDIGAYVGIPIVLPDGELFGTLCGFDPVAQSTQLLSHAPWLEILGLLLSAILDADLERTRQARLLERADMTAEADRLTGMFTQQSWGRYMASEEPRLRRFGDAVVVILIDLDRRKSIHGATGHAAGDELIDSAAKVLRNLVRNGDFVARLAGDEFGIIMSNVVPERCDRLVDRIATGFQQAGVPGTIGHAPYTMAAGFRGAITDAIAGMYERKLRRNPHAIAS